MRNQLQTYFLPEDERQLSTKLRELAPTVYFVDHDDALNDSVTLHSDLNACRSGFAYIWEAESINPEIATASWIELARTKTGKTALAQFLRSRITTEQLVNGANAELLLSGRVAIMASETNQQEAFRNTVYKAISKVSTATIYPVSPTTREFIGKKQLGARVGYHAADWCREDSHLLRHAATQQLYGLPQIETAK